jgi:hypothetical protein
VRKIVLDFILNKNGEKRLADLQSIMVHHHWNG